MLVGPMGARGATGALWVPVDPCGCFMAARGSLWVLGGPMGAPWVLRPTPPGLLETTVQKVPRVKAPNKSLPSAVYCIEDKMWVMSLPVTSPVTSPLPSVTPVSPAVTPRHPPSPCCHPDVTLSPSVTPPGDNHNHCDLPGCHHLPPQPVSPNATLSPQCHLDITLSLCHLGSPHVTPPGCTNAPDATPPCTSSYPNSSVP